mmetsp:Transcript_107617/g.321847  ORF Transcript_107617/g.321847 Transcript_107617/m.321847 type:complete len:355 (-) Transcript_107617:97-1161(-)
MHGGQLPVNEHAQNGGVPQVAFEARVVVARTDVLEEVAEARKNDGLAEAKHDEHHRQEVHALAVARLGVAHRVRMQHTPKNAAALVAHPFGLGPGDVQLHLLGDAVGNRSPKLLNVPYAWLCYPLRPEHMPVLQWHPAVHQGPQLLGWQLGGGPARQRLAPPHVHVGILVEAQHRWALIFSTALNGLSSPFALLGLPNARGQTPPAPGLHGLGEVLAGAFNLPRCRLPFCVLLALTGKDSGDAKSLDLADAGAEGSRVGPRGEDEVHVLAGLQLPTGLVPADRCKPAKDLLVRCTEDRRARSRAVRLSGLELLPLHRQAARLQLQALPCQAQPRLDAGILEGPVAADVALAFHE